MIESNSARWVILVGYGITCAVIVAYITGITATEYQEPICNGCKTLETVHRFNGHIIFFGIITTIWSTILLGLWLGVKAI